MSETLVEFPAMFDDEAFERVMTEWAQSSAGIPSIFDAENGPQMDRTYALFTILSAADVTGVCEINEVTDDGEISRGYYKLEVIKLQVEVISNSDRPGESARVFCRKMQNALGSDLYSENLFLANDIGIQDTGTIKRIPMLEDNVRWKSRAMFEVTFNVACNASAVEILPSVRTVLVEGTLVNGNPVDLTASQTITVPEGEE